MTTSRTSLIHAPVGANAANHRRDVVTVQHLLNRAAGAHLAEDGVAGSQTIRQIRDYQARALHFARPDGRVDPGGRTLTSLLHKLAVRPAGGGGGHGGHSGGGGAAGGGATGGGATGGGARQAVDDAAQAAHPAAVRAPAQQQSVSTPGAGGGKLTEADFKDAATRLGAGVEPAIVHAVADVESGGKSGFGPAGLPIIAYEGHIFRRYTHQAYDRSHPLLSYPYVRKAGPEWQKNNKDQATAWATLNEAAALDHNAALQACSWGMFQVMGFNFKACGYADVDAFVAAMKAGEKGQLDAFVGFCLSLNGMVAAMRRKDFATIAQLYNGKDYGDYDRRMARAYARDKG